MLYEYHINSISNGILFEDVISSTMPISCFKKGDLLPESPIFPEREVIQIEIKVKDS